MSTPACVHFTAWFDDEICIRTSPFAPRTSWKVPILRMDARPYAVGDQVTLTVRAGDLSAARTSTWSSGPGETP